MKIKFNANVLVSLVIVGVCAFLAINLVIKFTSGRANHTDNSWEVNLPPIDEEISDSIAHYKYKQLNDSIATIRSLKNGDFMVSPSIHVDHIGIVTATSCDTCSLKWFRGNWFNDKTHQQPFLKLDAWKLAGLNDQNFIDDGKFYVKNGQGYVRKAITYTSVKRPDGSVYNKIKIADVPVKFRYNYRDNALLIPVTPTQAWIINKITVIVVISIFAYISFLLLVFVKFCISIQKEYHLRAKMYGD